MKRKWLPGCVQELQHLQNWANSLGMFFFFAGTLTHWKQLKNYTGFGQREEGRSPNCCWNFDVRGWWILRTKFLTKPLNHTVPRESILSPFQNGSGWMLAEGHGPGSPVLSPLATSAQHRAWCPSQPRNTPVWHSAHELRSGCWNISRFWFTLFFESVVNHCH